jgi:ATP-dependent DNA helicase RecG
MLKTELLEIITNGENSGIEFKRDDIRIEDLGKEIVALANFQGGRILLGVDDDGIISGIQNRGRSSTEEWVMQCFRDKVHPHIIPYYEEITIDPTLKVAVITIEQGTSKPYVLRHNGQERIYIRSGTISRDASREEQARLYGAGGLLHPEVLPVSGTNIHSLDLERIESYLSDVMQDPEIPSTENQWKERLSGLSFITNTASENTPCTIAGLLSFGVSPRRFLPQAGIRIMAFEGADKTYRALIDEVIDGPLFNRTRISENGNIEKVDDGLIEKLSAMIRPYISLEGETINPEMRRERAWLYPWEAVRETVINAIAHRDWTRSVDIEITVYSDRLEVISPGAMQNSMTIEKMIAGQRSPRNPLIVNLLRDYGYVDARGMGVRTKIIPLMKAENNQEPIFEATDDYVKVILRRKSNS